MHISQYNLKSYCKISRQLSYIVTADRVQLCRNEIGHGYQADARFCSCTTCLATIIDRYALNELSVVCSDWIGSRSRSDWIG